MTDDFSDDILEQPLEEQESELVSLNEDDAEYEPSSDVVDIDDMVEKVYGNKPQAGVPFSMAEEVEKDEEDRRGM